MANFGMPKLYLNRLNSLDILLVKKSGNSSKNSFDKIFRVAIVFNEYILSLWSEPLCLDRSS